MQGCGTSSQPKIEQETTHTVVVAEKKQTTQTTNTNTTAEQPDTTLGSTGEQKEKETSPTAMDQNKQVATAATAYSSTQSSSTPEAVANDFHAISNAPSNPSAIIIIPTKKKKAGDTVGLGKQAGAHDLSTQLTAVSSSDSDRAMQLFERFLSAIHSISSETNIDKACAVIIEHTCKILDCQRASLFFVDNDTDELELHVSNAGKNIRMPKGKGIAGHCATTGESVNISDAHLDSRFDSSHDAASGFRTRGVIACPVRDKSGEIVGVLMAINKNSPNTNDGAAAFGPLEKVLAENFASHTGLILRNCQLYEETRLAQRKIEILLDIVQLLHSDPNTNSLIFTLTNRSHTLVDGDRSTLYLVHKPTNCLVVQQGNVDIRVPFTKGIAGSVASTGELINITDCYADSRFDQSIDKKTGYRTKSMLCMPIFGPKKSSSSNFPTAADVIGVLQIINKKDDRAFEETDERLLKLLLELSGPILAASSFFASQSAPMTEAERMKASPRGSGGFNMKIEKKTSTTTSPTTAATSTLSPVKSGGGPVGGMRRVTEAEVEPMSEEEIRKARALAELDEEETEEATDQIK